MKILSTILIICIAIIAGPAIAHHPAEDIVDEEIYAMIDDMISETPHATIEFDNMGNTTTITVDSVSEAEDLIIYGLLADLSLLDEEITVTISFGNETETQTIETEEEQEEMRWTERDYWGRPVIFTINTLLCDPCDSE